jgi:hypothetical protein
LTEETMSGGPAESLVKEAFAEVGEMLTPG